jgi:membrane protein YdbS with pleckstrin-like domain
MTTIFENLPVEVESLPKVEDIDFKSIEKKYLRISLISISIVCLVLIAGYLAIAHFSEMEKTLVSYLAGSGALFLLGSFNFTMTILGFKKKKYALRQRDILYTKGLLWHVRTSIPFNRIQHAELKQGPLERMYGLHSLKVFTAGGQSSDLVIPGLKEETALAVKDFILGKTASDGDSIEP